MEPRGWTWGNAAGGNRGGKYDTKFLNLDHGTKETGQRAYVTTTEKVSGLSQFERPMSCSQCP